MGKSGCHKHVFYTNGGFEPKEKGIVFGPKGNGFRHKVGCLGCTLRNRKISYNMPQTNTSERSPFSHVHHLHHPIRHPIRNLVCVVFSLATKKVYIGKIERSLANRFYEHIGGGMRINFVEGRDGLGLRNFTVSDS